MGSLDSLTSDAGCSLGLRNFGARPIRTCGCLINSKVTGLVRENVSGSRISRGLFGTIFSSFVTCCHRRFLIGARTCSKVSRLLSRLGGVSVGLTIISGGSSSVTGGIMSSIFNSNIFSIIANGHTNLPAGPSPTLALLVVGRLKLAPSRYIFIKSSKVSALGTMGTNYCPLNIL